MAESNIKRNISIIEEGTSGIWTYRKYSDGTAECWGKAGATVNVTTAWGYLYYGSIAVPNFPFTFSAIPISSMTLHSTSGSAMLGANTVGVSTTNVGNIYVYSAGNMPSLWCTIDVHTVGKWK